jgi:hypothetical protein
MSWSGLMPAILPLPTCVVIQHVGERRAHPLPHRDPSANRRAPLCANRLSWSAGGRTWPGRSRHLSAPHKTAARSAADASLAQQSLHRSNRARLGQTTGRSRTRVGDHGKVARPRPWGRPAPTLSTRPRPCGQGGRGRETRGRGRPHSGHPGTPAPDTGHRTPAQRTPRHTGTGHRTRTGDERHSKHSDILDSHNHEDGRRDGEPLLWGPALAARQPMTAR